MIYPLHPDSLSIYVFRATTCNIEKHLQDSFFEKANFQSKGALFDYVKIHQKLFQNFFSNLNFNLDIVVPDDNKFQSNIFKKLH